MQQYNIINTHVISYQYIDIYLYPSFNCNNLKYMYWLNVFDIYISSMINNVLYNNVEVEKQVSALLSSS